MAAFYTILDHLDEKEQSANTAIDSVPMYSFSSNGADSVLIASDSEFAKVINGRLQSEIWPVIDELMTTLKVMNERLYNGVLRKLSQ